MFDSSVVEDSDLLDIGPVEYEALSKQGALREGMLQEKLQGGRRRCNVCQRRCSIPDGKAGYCMTRVNVGGTIYSTIYGVISSAAADPIEKKPVFHYRPGSLCFSVGSLGCNFRCLFCQNWQIAFADAVQPSGMCQYNFTADKLITAAQQSGSDGIAWTYNEPGIWLEYTLDSAKLAKEAGLYTVYVTNGYSTEEHLDLIGPYMDVYRVDIKSMSDEFYRRLMKAPSSSGIREVTRRARNKWNMHVECVTNIVPTWNDSDENIRSTARWIVESLGELTPWHVTRFFPYADMQDVPATPPAMLERAAEIGRQEGLRFVYIGNMATETGQNTYCYTDGTLAVERSGYQTRLLAVTDDGRCKTDGTDLGIRL